MTASFDLGLPLLMIAFENHMELTEVTINSLSSS